MPIDEKVLTAIKANSPTLTRLDLRRQRLTAKDMESLVEALSHNNYLTTLIPGWNPIGDDGAEILATIKHTSLTTLNLIGSQISDRGAKSLFKNTTFTDLCLADNDITDEGVKALAGNTTLVDLDLTSAWIKDEGAKALANNNALTALNLNGNEISDEAIKVLAQSPSLTTLHLSGNQLGHESLKVLLNNPRLTHLYLSYPFTDHEIAVITHALRSNLSLVRIEFYDKDAITTEMKLLLNRNRKIANEKDPVKRANLIGNIAHRYQVPSLFNIGLFAVKQQVASDKELNELESLLPAEIYSKLTKL